MIKNIQDVDRAMFLSLLLVIVFVPFSSAVIQTGLFFLLIGWFTRTFLIWKSNPSQGLWKSLKFPTTGVDWPLIALGVLIVVTIPMSHAPTLSLKKFFSRFMQQIFLMYMVVTLVRTTKRLYTVLGLFLCAMVVVMADIAAQYFCGQSFIFNTDMIFGRITGPMKHPNDLASLLITILPITLILIMTRHSWVSLVVKPKFIRLVNWALGILFFLLIVALGLTASRAGWLSFAVALIGFCFYLKDYKLLARCMLCLSIFFVFFGIYCMNIRKDVFNPANKNNLAELYSNSSDRSVYWGVALDVFKKYPIYGCGYNAYIATLEDLKVTHQEYPHNSFLHVLAELGILGAVFFVWFLFQLFVIKGHGILKSISSQRNLYLLGCGIFCGILGWFFHSLMDTPWESLQLSILWWSLTGVLLALPQIAKQAKN